MRAIVFISAVQNPEEHLSLNACAQAFANDAALGIANDFDLIALEAAVQLKEAGAIDEIISFSLSDDRRIVQKALAIGADRAILIDVANSDIEAHDVVAACLLAFPDPSDCLFMLGKLGVNYESHLVGQALAKAYACPCLCSVTKIERADAFWRFECEEEGGKTVFEATLPLVMTNELRLAELRHTSLPMLLKAKRKTIENFDFVPSDKSQSLDDVAHLALIQSTDSPCLYLDAPSFVAHMLDKQR